MHYSTGGYDLIVWWQIAAEILRRAEVEKIEADFILEGGSVHVDGEG